MFLWCRILHACIKELNKIIKLIPSFNYIYFSQQPKTQVSFLLSGQNNNYHIKPSLLSLPSYSPEQILYCYKPTYTKLQYKNRPMTKLGVFDRTMVQEGYGKLFFTSIVSDLISASVELFKNWPASRLSVNVHFYICFG